MYQAVSPTVGKTAVMRISVCGIADFFIFHMKNYPVPKCQLLKTIMILSPCVKYTEEDVLSVSFYQIK